MNRHRTETIEAARLVLEDGMRPVLAATKMNVHYTSVWRAVKLFTPYNRTNKKKLHGLLT